MSEPILSLRDVSREYTTEAGQLTVLNGADFDLHPGEIVGLIGPSGSGKSSLLHVAGLLEAPNTGEVHVAGAATSTLTDKDRTALRRNAIGFVYQFHHLLPEFTAQQNIALPQVIAGIARSKADIRADELLALMGLAERAHHQPPELSGGEQQRVAIARALANQPSILLADEPTGNLDPDTSQAVFNTLTCAVREEGAAALIATHNHHLARKMDRVVTLDHGRIIPWND
ncbi:ABC transporter ATP-binding protein [Maricaulis sp. D1M11]|uniref:ABC transporter ATP-binding protein n=1 Tax=Maricaulis sp. D1M11 TaxID=3076117 RepID=UPI0039B48C21